MKRSQRTFGLFLLHIVGLLFFVKKKKPSPTPPITTSSSASPPPSSVVIDPNDIHNNLAERHDAFDTFNNTLTHDPTIRSEG